MEVKRMCKQYWADAATKNCVWLFQTKEVSCNREHGCTCGAEYDEEGELKQGEECKCEVTSWRTENVFLTREEAMAHGEARPYAWGKYKEGWRIWGVMCIGLMAEIIGKHVEEFEDKVEYITKTSIPPTTKDGGYP